MNAPGRLAALIDGLPRVVVLLLGLALLAGVGAIDFVTASDAVFSVFYAVPIALATWAFGRPSGLLFAAASSILWALGDRYSLDADVWTGGVVWWNAVVRFAFFALVVFILAALKRALDGEQRLARVDALTSVPNGRLFR